MIKRFLVLGLAAFLIDCAQADPDQYKDTAGGQPVAGESNGIFYDATNDYLSMFVNDVEVGYIDSSGNLTMDGSVAAQSLDPADDAATCFGTGDDFCIEFNAANADPDSAYIGVGTDSNQLVIGEVADTTGAAAADLVIAKPAYPMINIHGVDATDALDYVTLGHDATNGVLAVGQGKVSIPSGITSSANATDVLTCTGAAPTITLKNNEAAALSIKASGTATDFMVIDTTTGAEELTLKCDTSVSCLRVDVGVATFDEEVVMTAGFSSAVTAADAITLTGAAPTMTLKDNEAAALVIKSSGAAALATFDTQTGAEKLVIVGDTSTSVFHVDTGFATFDETAVFPAGLSSAVTGADAFTLTGAAPTMTIKDAEAAAFAINSSGTSAFVVFDTQTGAEQLELTGAAVGANVLHVDQGTMLVDETAAFTGGFTAGAPAILHQVIRFCGNGPAGGTETFLSPVPFDDTEADFIDGGAGCDGEDNVTIGTADEPWPLLKDAAFKPVAMVCTAICTGASAADDVIVFRMMDDTAAVTGMTCSTAALGGDATAAQCTVTDTSPATVAAGSAIAIGVDDTDDSCADAGDDFSCLVYVTF